MSDPWPPGQRGPADAGTAGWGFPYADPVDSGQAGSGPAAAAPGGAGPRPDRGAPGGPAATGWRPGPPAAGARRRARWWRRHPWRAVILALAAIAIIAWGGYALLGDRLLVVRSVTVTGTHLVTPAQVRAAADVPDGTPLLHVNAAAVERRVAAIRQVAAVAVTKDWPDRLLIAVTERVPAVAVRAAGGGYELVDPAGVIVRLAKAKPAALPLLVTSPADSALRGDPGVAAAAAVLAEVRPWLARSVTEVRVARELTGAGAGVRESEQVTLSLRDHRTVRWGGTDHAALKNRELAVLMRGTARYFDVSAPGIVVTR